MAKVRFKKYLHSDKESNDDIVEHFQDENLKYVGYEVEVVYEYDTETKAFKVVGAEGHFLSDEKITESELEEITG